MQIQNDRLRTNIEKVFDCFSKKNEKKKKTNSRFCFVSFGIKQMHQSIQTKNVVYCLSFHEIFDPEVSSYLLLSSATNYSKDIFFRYKFNPFALLTSCRRFICILFEEKNFFFLFYIYIDVNKFTKFYHFHFKRKKKNKQKE